MFNYRNIHFKNKIIWITSASSGIGRELAIQLTQEEAILIFTATNQKVLNWLALEWRTRTISHVLPFNLLNFDIIPKLVNQAILLEGNIEIVNQSAGISQRLLANETTIAVNRKLTEHNLVKLIK